MITSIDPSQIRQEARAVDMPSTGMSTFSTVMASSAPTAGASLSVAGQNKSAAVTSAAISGVSGATATNGYMTPFGSPAAMPVSSPFQGGLPTGGGSGAAGGVLPPGANTSLMQGGAGDVSYLQNLDIIGRMRDTNMQMLVLQSDVQNVNREFSTLSNVLKSKHDTEMNSVRNIRVA
ncbi:MAG: hypothetical protein HYS22_08360 [Deltaproteobacteria bacterium]|nr:hypothetical protein [Deltaproteobacteria bacterium]